ncbi:unnamed protein product [Caenorhabditis bovis]|uniref:JmjC domain-containing protein n=1 Tax=Caenorhabditis bovis TaxID=2654633 RepID=A0A8S1EPS6_9PELO|nr:unnamed protein product [Caenorhabditis bovis]
MPPKRKSRGGGTGRGRGRPRGQNKKQKRNSSSEDEQEVSDIEDEDGFNKASLQRCVKYNFEELMNDPSLQHPEFIHRIEPEELNMEYFEKTGLEHPLLFKCDPKLIGMTVPDQSFSVDDVLNLVGGNRIIEVVEVSNQGSVKMSLQDFINFYKTPAKDRKVLYNVLSLEFSLTPLEDVVKSPTLVREIDWVGNKWPDELRQRWIAFNGRDKKLYTPHHTFPKVQNYCLMSVADCYTDFHIDFSGTSVWYHVLKGKKVFWLIPPTETNFLLYQEFIQTVGDSTFFGKSVETCHTVILDPGDTMLIPSGWIHAVYTPEDSLVFGGNFLHSMSCQMQIRVYQCENRLNITRKFRLPYNEELLFFVIADYVKKWTGREYARPLRIEDARMDYVGEKWKAAGGHLKKIEYSDFEHGVELTNDMIEDDTNLGEKEEVKVIAMHAENSVFASARKQQKQIHVDNGLDEEADDDDDEDNVSAEEREKLHDAEIDALSASNPLIFYKNSKHDFVRNKSVPDHKLPVGYEPPINFNQEELDKISPRLLAELEALGTYLKRKAKVEISEGICQPASLLNCFLAVLKRRKAQLEGKEVEETVVAKRKITRGAISTGDLSFCEDGLVKTENSSNVVAKEEPSTLDDTRFNAQDFPEEFLESEEKIKEAIRDGDDDGSDAQISEHHDNTKAEDQDEDYRESRDNTPIGATRRSSRQAATRASVAIKNEVEDENSVKKEEPEEEDDLTWRQKMEKEEKDHENSQAPDKKSKKMEEKAKKVKLTREEKREKKEKEQERKRKSSTLDAALIAAHGMSKTKKKKKPEKPMFVGGVPMVPIMNEPAAPNPYNYDPMMEMVKLGTGQLKSAYRKTKNNIELNLEKKKFKLERQSQEEASQESQENNVKKSEGAKMAKQPISIDIFDIPSSSSAPVIKKKKEKKVERQDSPSESSHNKLKPVSPALSSPHSVTKDRRKSGEHGHSSTAKVYMPTVSRQDRMIADAPSPATPATSRHSSISERRPINLPSTPSNISRNSSIDIPYTPSAPVHKTSWMSAGSSDRADSVDESPIDVVSDQTPPTILSPQQLSMDRKDVRKDIGNGNPSPFELLPIIPKPSKIPASTAINQLKSLVTQLNQLNEVE